MTTASTSVDRESKVARTTFHTPSAFRGVPSDYKLLPFRFMRFDPLKYILVNECGEYVFLNAPLLTAFVNHRLTADSPEYGDLKAKHFLMDNASSSLLGILATKYRTKKSFLAGFTKLHMFVVTLRCDHSCLYCQVSRQSEDRTAYDMTEATAKKAIDLMFRTPASAITMEFQGGEPLLNFPLIKLMVEYADERNRIAGKHIDKVIATNLSKATTEILQYCRDKRISLSTSLDGPAWIHNANRPNRGNDSYEVVTRNIEFARSIVGIQNVAALMTTTRLSLKHPREVIDEYVERGFRSIFLRSISPYGFAVKTRDKTGYMAREFLDFYREALAYIIELNRKGTDFIEVFAKILLAKILTPFPTSFTGLQSPASAGIGAVVYNYDGDVYATDESRMLAEMGDKTFRFGNVHQNSYEELFGGDAIRTLCSASVNESLPGCSDCAYQAYCGADPIFHHTTQGDAIGHRPTSDFCRQNTAIINELFRYILSGDREVMRIFWAWINDRSVREDSSCQAR